MCMYIIYIYIYIMKMYWYRATRACMCMHAGTHGCGLRNGASPPRSGYELRNAKK